MEANDKYKLSWGLVSKYRDHLYGFLIIWIMFFHIWEISSKYLKFNWIVIDIIKRGNMGVDIFLLLSGISLYFSMMNNPHQSVRQFYKKRLIPLIKIYLFVCIPYFLIMLLSGHFTSELFIRQVLFLNNQVNSFWFILIISICYFMYPLFYKYIQEDKEIRIYLILFLYTLMLILLSLFNIDYYKYYEILLSRIPIFMVGTLLGKKVYTNEPICGNLLLFSILILLSLWPFNYLLANVVFLKPINLLLIRYFLGLQGVAVVIVFIAIAPYLESTKALRALSRLGKITLEIYVVHIIVRSLLTTIFGLKIYDPRSLLIFCLIYFLVSIPLASLIHKVLSGIFVSKS